jgi:pyrimidine 5'-nucleotidase
MDLFFFALSVAIPVVRHRTRHGSNYSKKRAGMLASPLPPSASSLQEQLEQGTSLNAKERVCTVTPNNVPLSGGGHDRATMRLIKLWHRATYCVIRHVEPSLPEEGVPATRRHPHDHPNMLQGEEDHDIYVLVQKRSSFKDYCPSKLDPTPGGVVGHGEECLDNITRELEEEMGISSSPSSGGSSLAAPLKLLFTFPYQDDHVRVWGYLYECTFQGSLSDLQLQEEEVETVFRMSLPELYRCMESQPSMFMPDSIHAMSLYLQYQKDLKVQRRFLKGSSSDLEAYSIRPKIQAIFFDCDDCLYFDNWNTANRLTAKIDEWCVNHGLSSGHAYQLYKKYGTALRGLLAEGYLEHSDEAIRKYLEDVHDIGVEHLIAADPKLQAMLAKLDPSIPRFIFTASVEQHARRCLQALGVEQFFPNRVIDCLACDLETKHSAHSFQRAMDIANILTTSTHFPPRQACLLLDDSVTNIEAARQFGWRACLVGKVGRDSGLRITSDDAELELDTIHEMEALFPELFVSSELGTEGG